MKRRVIVLISIVLVIGAGIAIYAWITKPAQETKQAIAASTAEPKVPAEIKRLETMFNSPDTATQSKALVAGLDEQYRQQGQNPLKAGVTLEFDYASYQPIGDNAATIEAKLNNGERYRVHLVRQSGQWYIWNTEKR